MADVVPVIEHFDGLRKALGVPEMISDVCARASLSIVDLSSFLS